MLQSLSVSLLCPRPIQEGGKAEHRPVPPTFSVKADRHFSENRAVGCMTLVPELADRRIAILGGIAAGTPCSE